MKMKTRSSMIPKPHHESKIKVLLETGVNHEYEIRVDSKVNHEQENEVIRV